MKAAYRWALAFYRWLLAEASRPLSCPCHVGYTCASHRAETRRRRSAARAGRTGYTGPG